MKMKSIITTIITTIITSLILAGCGSSWEDDKYKIYHLDNFQCLGSKIDDDAIIFQCAIINVIAAGSNTKYVVIKQKISENDVIKYFYIDKARSIVGSDASEVVEGPFDEIKFEKFKASLGLPDFEWGSL